MTGDDQTKLGAFTDAMAAALAPLGDPPALEPVRVVGEGDPPSWFAVGDLAAASVGAAGASLARFAALDHVTVDRRLAWFWFTTTLRPDGWTTPPVWNAVSGDYRTSDGWLRIHANAPHHRAAALRVLGAPAEDRDGVAAATAAWTAGALETAIVDAGGAAAEMRAVEAWAEHPQGAAVGAEPLIAWTEVDAASPQDRTIGRDDAPLAGVRVLDLTRVLAGPVATRFLAGFGAEVLRIDPPDWAEPENEPEMTLGKRCAALDLTTSQGRDALLRLAAEADVLAHGYRPGALARLGLGPERLREARRDMIDVALDAYGWTGPWAGRRGFDSLVQMSSGIAAYGMSMERADRPRPLPAQALDHATGYLMAAAVLSALDARRRAGRAFSARLSLARTAKLLIETARTARSGGLAPETADDLSPQTEPTAWGPGRRLKGPLTVGGRELSFSRPAGPLRAVEPRWR